MKAFSVKNIIKLTILLLIAFSVFSPQLFAIDWHVKTAKYCLELEPGETQYTGFVDLGRQLFPAPLTNGVDVRNELGEKIPFYLYPETHELIIAPAPENLLRYVYFGFAKKQPFNQWDTKAGKVPAKETLALTIKRFWMRPITQKEKKNKQQKRLDRLNKKYDTKINRQQIRLTKLKDKHSRLQKTLDEMKTSFSQLKSKLDAQNLQDKQASNKLSAQLQQVKTSHQKTQQSLKSVTNKYKETTNFSKKTKAELKSANSKQTSLSHNIQKNKNNLEKNLKNINNAKQQRQKQKTLIKQSSVSIPMPKLPKALTEAKKEAEKAFDQIKQAKHKINALQSQIKTAKTQIEIQLRSKELKSATDTLKEHEKVASSANKKVATETAKFEAAKRNAQNSEKARIKKLAKLTNDLTISNKSLATLNNEHKTLQQLDIELNKKLTTTKASIQKLQTTLNTHHTVSKALQQQKSSLQTESKKQDSTLKSLTQQIGSIENKINSRKNELSVKQADIRRIEKQVAYLKSKNKSALTYLDKLNKDKEIAQNEFWINEKALEEKDKRRLEALFNKKPQTEQRKFDKILLTTNPFGENYNFGACFSGNLRIREAGEYDFAINTTSDCCLIIDNKLVISRSGRQKRSKKWLHPKRIKLTPGFHKLDFYYQKNSGETYAAVAWKKAAEDDDSYKLLTKSAFNPGVPNTIMRCFDQNNNDYPLISYYPKHVFYFTKDEKTLWQKCEITSDFSSSDLIWQLNGAQKHHGKTLDILHTPETSHKITLGSNSNAFPKFNIELPKTKESPIIVKPNIFLELWTPTFIYDDEQLEMDIEVRSELPNDLDAYLQINVNKANELISPSRDVIHLKKKPLEDEYKYQPAYFVKKKIILDGSKLVDGLRLTITLSAPGKTILTKTLKFIKLAKTPQLVETQSGLESGKDERIIPILHRLTLSEKRNWSFTELVRSKVIQPEKVLFITDNIANTSTSFKEKLKTKLKADETTLDFIDWNTEKTAGIPLRATFAKYLNALKTIDSEVAVLIPSSQAIENGTPTRLHKRILAAIIETLHDNPNVRSIKLCTPLPTLFHEKMEKEMVNAVKMLSREYGVEVIDLNYYIRNQADWQKLYHPQPDNPQIIDSMPVQGINKITDYILEFIP